jgi:hypothetical protein
MRRYFDPHFHLLAQIDLPDNAFLFGGISYDAPSVFQIWQRMPDIRIVPPLQVPRADYMFVKKGCANELTIAFRRVGFYAGTFYVQWMDKSEQSHYFIQFARPIQNIMPLLEHLQFADNNTVGPKSIGKQELICALNGLFEELGDN